MSGLHNAYQCQRCEGLFTDLSPTQGGSVQAPYTFQVFLSYRPDQPKVLCPQCHAEFQGVLRRFWERGAHVVTQSG